MITYPVPSAARFTVYRISTLEEIAWHQPWPVSNGGPRPNPDPDYEYLLEVATDRPDYDQRQFTLEPETVLDLTEKEIRSSWKTTPRPREEVEINIANAEAEANADMVRQNELMKKAILGIGVLMRQLRSQQLTAPELELKADIENTAALMWENNATAAKLKADFEGGKPIDLDAAWKKRDDLAAASVAVAKP